MTFKLAKMETKTSIRYLAFAWAGVLAMSIIVGIELKLLDHISNTVFGIISGISGFLFGTFIVVMVVGTIAIVVIRFWKGLLGDEGYLMHTLPVKTWQLITAKGIVATIAVVIGFIVTILAIMIIGLIVDAGNLLEIIRIFFKEIGTYPQYIPMGLIWIVAMIASCSKSIYQMYAAMAIGQLANRYRKLLAVGSYIGICTALSVIAGICMILSELIGFDEWVFNYSGDGMLFMYGMAIVVLLATALQVAVFHIITERLLNKKLNLL